MIGVLIGWGVGMGRPTIGVFVVFAYLGFKKGFCVFEDVGGLDTGKELGLVSFLGDCWSSCGE